MLNTSGVKSSWTTLYWCKSLEYIETNRTGTQICRERTPFFLNNLYTSTLADKKIICSYVDAPSSVGAPSYEGGTIEAFCRAGDRMTLALGKVDSSAGNAALNKRVIKKWLLCHHFSL